MTERGVTWGTYHNGGGKAELESCEPDHGFGWGWGDGEGEMGGEGDGWANGSGADQGDGEGYGSGDGSSNNVYGDGAGIGVTEMWEGNYVPDSYEIAFMERLDEVTIKE